MIKIVKKKINMSDELKDKIKWSCKFNNISYEIIEGYLRIVEHTNIAYMEPHKVIIDDKFKHKMTNVFKEQLNDLQELVPDFKIASGIIHYDETSPHLHIVGVPIKYKNKNGMSKQVGKCDVFTRDSLRTIQDKMRTLCIASFNKEYGLNNILKKKEKGRNKDINVKDMTNY